MFNEHESILESISTNRKYLPKIKVIGLGGAGGNIVKKIISNNFFDDTIDIIAINTDLQSLEDNIAPHKLPIGNKTHYGAGGRVDAGKKAAIESTEEIKQLLYDTELLFLISGMGGGTGTGAAPVIAKIAKDMDILTISIVTIPFVSEGAAKLEKASIGVKNLKEESDTILVIDNEKSVQQSKIISGSSNIQNTIFELADDAIVDRVHNLYSLIYNSEDMNVDFADIKSMIQDSGIGFISTGKSKGQNAILKAVKLATKSDIQQNASLEGARSIIINFKIPQGFNESINPALEYVSKFTNGAETKFGVSKSERNSVEITIVGTRFNETSLESGSSSYENYIDTLKAWVPPITNDLSDRPAITIKKAYIKSRQESFNLKYKI